MKLFVRGLAALVSVVVFVGAVIVGCPSSARNAEDANKASGAPQSRDWALFGGTPQRNHVNTWDRNIATDWAVPKRDENDKALDQGKNIKWSAEIGSRSYGGLVIAGGRIFVGTNNTNPRDRKIKGAKGILMCFRESDGAFMWQAVHDKLPSGLVNDWRQEAGIVSHPVVEGDRLYYFSNRCELVCAEVGTGKKIWLLDMINDLKVVPHNLASGCPLIAGDLVFVVTGNGVDGGHVNIPQPQAPSFLAVNKESGKVVWQDNAPSVRAVGLNPKEDRATIARLQARGELIMHGQWSNPAYAVVKGKPQVIFPGGDGWIRAYEPNTGKLIWKFDANPKDSKYELGGRGTRSDFIATPVIVDNKCVIGTGQDPEHYEGVGHLWCIDITKTGDVSSELVIDEKGDAPKTKPNPNSAVIWHYGGPTSKEDRKKLERDHYFGRTMSSVVVHNGFVYAAELAGYLHCLDFETGKPFWTYDIKGLVWGPPSLIDKHVYMCNEDGDVWVFKTGAFCDMVRKIKMDAPIRTAPPIAVNGVLYITTESRLYAIAAPK